MCKLCTIIFTTVYSSDVCKRAVKGLSGSDNKIDY